MGTEAANEDTGQERIVRVTQSLISKSQGTRCRLGSVSDGAGGARVMGVDLRISGSMYGAVVISGS